MAAIDRTTLKPSLAQRLLRSTGVRNRVLPAAKLDRWAADGLHHDVLNPDARAFHDRATAEGLDIGWHERAGGVHAWMLLPGRHARAALAEIRQVLSP